MVVVVTGAGGKEGEEGGGVGWGTWEELVLGSAVLRHGSAAWKAVAAELCSRSPCIFSPEECEAKFSEIQTRYQKCDAWFDELRKQRVAELKRELEKSESFIGSLQSTIESLSNSKHDDGNSECHTNHTESCSHNENAVDTNSSSKELSKDRSSAASFTEEANNSYKSQKAQHCSTDSIQVNNTSAETLIKPHVDNVSAKDGLLWGSRKRRGVRDKKVLLKVDDRSRDSENTSRSGIKREGSSEGCIKNLKTPKAESDVSVREGSSEVCTKDLKMKTPKVESGVSACKGSSESCLKDFKLKTPKPESGASVREGSSEGCMKDLKIPKVESGVSVSEKAKPNLTDILKIISTQGDCYMLQRQIDIQRKRARYKKVIRRHMDFRILHSKIKSGAISSTKELLKDMLLFVNNVLAFYPKATLEHMAAIELRDLVSKTLQQSSSTLSKDCEATGIASTPAVKKIARTLPPVRHVPRDAKRNKVCSSEAGSTVSKVKKESRGDAAATGSEKTTRRNAPAKKRGVGRPPKSGQKRAAAQQESPNKGRKKGRR